MKNNPAFPGPSNTGFQIGMTKLEYAAIHAPEEIPSWFKHRPPSMELPPDPKDLVESKRHTMEAKDYQEATQWLYDGCWDLPDQLIWLDQACKKRTDALSIFNHENTITRYFQWKIFYAETLLKTLTTYETTTQPISDSGEDKA